MQSINGHLFNSTGNMSGNNFPACARTNPAKFPFTGESHQIIIIFASI